MPQTIRRLSLVATQAALVLLCGVVAANDPKQADAAADADLLEFLGSVDSGADSQATADDGSWIDYLSQTDIGKLARTSDPKDASRKQTATDATAPAPAPGDKKNE